MTSPDAIGRLNALLVMLFDDLLKGLNLLHIAVATDDIFQVLEEPHVVLILTLGLHKRDLLDFTLEDQESIVVEVDTLFLEHGLQRGVVNRVAINAIL